MTERKRDVECESALIRTKATCKHGCLLKDDAQISLSLKGRRLEPRPAVKEVTTKSGEERGTGHTSSPQLTRLEMLHNEQVDDGRGQCEVLQLLQGLHSQAGCLSATQHVLHFYGTQGFVDVSAYHWIPVRYINSLYVL